MENRKMKSIIKQVSDSFLEEASASPRMLEDLAAMEKYMSESEWQSAIEFMDKLLEG